uniref:Uncharacterized protein n=1 Tax=Arundo donax TaxID=35708 RepID=A0A0A8Y6K5_ARUDO
MAQPVDVLRRLVRGRRVLQQLHEELPVDDDLLRLWLPAAGVEPLLSATAVAATNSLWLHRALAIHV